jgi:hypothetical protein
MLYFTYAAPWYRDLHMFETPKSLLAPAGAASAPEMAARALADAVWAARPGAGVGNAAGANAGTDYGHPHFTERFDLLLLEGLLEPEGSPARQAAQGNAAACLRFCQLPALAREALVAAAAAVFVEGGVLDAAKLLELGRLREARRKPAPPLAFSQAVAFTGYRVGVGFGRIVALCHRSSTSYHIR